MKSLVVFSCLLIAAAIVRANDEENKFAEVMGEQMKECAKELNVDPESMKHMDGQTLSEDQRHQLGCFRACVMKKGDIMVDSKIISAKVKEVIEKMHNGHPEEITKRTMFTDSCIDEVKDETDECKIAVTFSECYMAKMKEA